MGRRRDQREGEEDEGEKRRKSEGQGKEVGREEKMGGRQTGGDERKREQKVEDVFCQAEGAIRDLTVTGVQKCALPIWATGR